MAELKRACPICKSIKGEVLISQQFMLPPFHPLSNGYDVVSCFTCGFVYADTPAVQGDYDEFYSQFSKYENGANIIGSGDSIYDNERLSNTAMYIVEKVGVQKKIIDVGCANGGLLRELTKLGCNNLSGYDPSQFCVNYITEKIGLEAHLGSIFEIPERLAEQKYEVVLLSHVLEHLLEVQKAIKNISEIIADKGFLYLEVPDATNYTQYFVNPFHYFDTEHINHFSSHFLKMLGISNSFTVVDEGFKEISLSDNTIYPAIYILLQKRTNDTSPPFGFTRDNELKEAICSYIDKSFKEFNLALIDKISVDQRQYIFWGVGSTTLRILASTNLKKANVKYFVDNNTKTHSSTILGKPVLAPEELRGSVEPIVIFSKIYKNEILKQVKDLGLTNEIITLN